MERGGYGVCSRAFGSGGSEIKKKKNLHEQFRELHEKRCNKKK